MRDAVRPFMFGIAIIGVIAAVPAQSNDEPKEKPTKPAKKPAKVGKEERVRTEVAGQLPTEKGTEILVFVTIEKTQQPLLPNSKRHTSLTVTRTSKKVHRMDDREKAVDFLTKWLLEQPTDSSSSSAPKSGAAGSLKSRRRSWAFENAFARSNEGAKDADELVKSLTRQFQDEEKEEARKSDLRRKLLEGSGS
jgi:hypothetical protein